MSMSNTEKSVKDIRRNTRRKFSTEEKIRIVLDGLRGESSIAELCRQEGINPNLYYRWSKDFLEAGKKRLSGDTAREANTDEVTGLKRENGDLKQAVAELYLRNDWLKHSLINRANTAYTCVRQVLFAMPVHPSRSIAMLFKHILPGSFLAGMIFAGGCIASNDDANRVPIDQAFQLRVGQSAHIGNTDVIVGFDAVSSDSRCGKGEVCVWEGDAIVLVWLQLAGGAKEERALHTRLKSGTTARFDQYSITLLALHPTAISGRAIEQAEYVANLQVVKGVPPGEVIH
jgi:transposase